MRCQGDCYYCRESCPVPSRPKWLAYKTPCRRARGSCPFEGYSGEFPKNVFPIYVNRIGGIVRERREEQFNPSFRLWVVKLSPEEYFQRYNAFPPPLTRCTTLSTKTPVVWTQRFFSFLTSSAINRVSTSGFHSSPLPETLSSGR